MTSQQIIYDFIVRGVTGHYKVNSNKSADAISRIANKQAVKHTWHISQITKVLDQFRALQLLLEELPCEN